MQKVTPKNQNNVADSNQEAIHIPVLMKQVLQYLDPSPGNSYLDLTAGYGGHASEVLERTLDAPAVLVDRDQNSIDYLREKFNKKSVVLRHQDFLEASRDLHTSGEQFDLILADLGVASPHLNNASRGFAISKDGPLDMRMDQRQELDAKTVVNSYSEAELLNLITRYGEDPRARKLARLIVLNRPLNTTTELATLANQVWPPGKSKVNPATRLFQALRIEVNDELDQIEQALPLWIDLLKPGGRLVVISFHSLEDRIVKNVFREQGADTFDATLHVLTKHPVTAETNEIVLNPRSRSAKLRAAVKIKTKIGG
jgi:16S rRNA (cytosine1402-N4)-methyltransferase